MQTNRKRCQSYASQLQLSLVYKTKILSTSWQKGNASRKLFKTSTLPHTPTVIHVALSAIAASRVVSTDKSDGLLLGLDRTLQLGVLCRCHNPLKSAPWLKPPSH